MQFVKPAVRSEEHTSELQSQFHLECRRLFLKDTATTEIYTLSLHDALPIFPRRPLFASSFFSLTDNIAACSSSSLLLDRKSTRLNSSHSSISNAVDFF